MITDEQIKDAILLASGGNLDAYNRAVQQAIAIGGAVVTRFDERTLSWHYDVVPPSIFYGRS